MNSHQKVVVIVAAVNVGLILLFPPVLDDPLYRNALPNFAGFVPCYTLGVGQRVFRELLTLEILFVAANALAGYLVTAGEDWNLSRRSLGIAVFVSVNLAVILLFPPFETYGSIIRSAAPNFDGFYFVFGDRSRRAIFTPVLYLQFVLVGANALVFWLLFGTLNRNRPPQPGDLLRIAGDMPREEVMKLSEALRKLAGRASPDVTASEDETDRRRRRDPSYRGSDRRSGRERRRQPR